MRLIPLTKGYSAAVDDADFEEMNRWKWSASERENGVVYAVRQDRETGRLVYMHRVVNRTPAALATDHLDHDGLNNTRANLRTVTTVENAMNARSHSDAVSKFKGVSPNRKRGKPWIAKIRNTYLGVFATEQEAADAYRAAAGKELP